jgi:hypothetical protein
MVLEKAAKGPHFPSKFKMASPKLQFWGSHSVYMNSIILPNTPKHFNTGKKSPETTCFVIPADR